MQDEKQTQENAIQTAFKRKPSNEEWVPLLTGIKASNDNLNNFAIDRVTAEVHTELGTNIDTLQCRVSLKLQTVPKWDAEDFLVMTLNELAVFKKKVTANVSAEVVKDAANQAYPILNLSYDFVDNAVERIIAAKPGHSHKRKPAIRKNKRK